MDTRKAEVIIVGAGPAGLGCAHALREIGVERLVVLERETIGSSFRRWPREMRLITPSFHSNPFFATDLNAISPRTSPGDLYGREHLSGIQYAAYLKAFAEHYHIPVEEGIEVQEVEPEAGGFSLRTRNGNYWSRFLVWATGEFGFPVATPFPGAEHCQASGQIASWSDLDGDDIVVIGGYESGMDAAYHLAGRGLSVTVLSRGAPWSVDDPDPSVALSPYTKERMARICRALPGAIRFEGGKDVVEVIRSENGYQVLTRDGQRFVTRVSPVLAVGYESGLKRQIGELFTWENGQPLFSEEDASLLYPNLYYSGPSLVHRGSKFCFIYKFRSRFGVIAKSIGEALGCDLSPLEDMRQRGFLIEDLDCCTDCQCDLEEDDRETLASGGSANVE